MMTAGEHRTATVEREFPHPPEKLRSVVTSTLTPTGTGTRLRMEQSGFRPDQKQAYGGAFAGWAGMFDKLERVLARQG